MGRFDMFPIFIATFASNKPMKAASWQIVTHQTEKFA